MVDPFVWLWLLCFSMLTGSFLAGNVPLAFHFSENRLRDVSSFGAGLLVGTALSVIIPEGVETLYAAYEGKEGGEGLQTAPEEVPVELLPMDSLSQGMNAESQSLEETMGLRRTQRDETDSSRMDRRTEDSREEQVNGWREVEPSVNPTLLNKRDVPDASSSSSKDQVGFRKTNETTIKTSEPETDHHHHDSPHRLVGLALTTGFVFMLFVEQFAHHDHSNNHKRRHHSPVQEFSAIPMSENGASISGTVPSGGKKGSATIGLVVHAAADGIALGAASSSNQSSLEMIVFLAIMLHKAPSAFGLCTYLLHEGLTRRQIRQHLALFSVSAPLAALLTFAVLHNSGFDPLEMRKWTGVLLLFSAGTFLHVAIHIMNQVDATGSRAAGGMEGNGIGALWNRWRGFAILVAGVFFPLVVSIEHGH